jgi:tRNA (guanine26-N2/guanine27-N2)-dimethyltransferase
LELRRIREGGTDLLTPEPSAFMVRGRFEPSLAPVFYNPKMEFSRDIAVLLLRLFSGMRDKPLEVCDPLAGSGARGIRYAKEVCNLASVVISDLNEDAIPLIRENAKINGVEGKVTVACKDANLLLTEHAEPGQRFDYVDVDPFGTPSPFVDSAIRATKNGGVIALTATDTAPLCGIYPRACFRKYGGLPIRGEFCHETGLRLMIGDAVTEALKHDFGTRVLISYSVDHYFRAYLQLSLGAKKGDESAAKMGYILHCPSCGWRSQAALGAALPCSCPGCNGPIRRGGPLWLGELGDEVFLSALASSDRSGMGSEKRIAKFLPLLLGELGLPPTYYLIDEICSRIKRDVPQLAMVLESLKELGYRAAPTHFHPKAVKTDAPIHVLTSAVEGLRSGKARE